MDLFWLLRMCTYFLQFHVSLHEFHQLTSFVFIWEPFKIHQFFIRMNKRAHVFVTFFHFCTTSRKHLLVIVFMPCFGNPEKKTYYPVNGNGFFNFYLFSIEFIPSLGGNLIW